MPKEIMIFIKDVKYYEAEHSLVIVGVEVESKRPITQQISVHDFLANTGMFSKSELELIPTDADRCKLFASQLRGRREPFRLVFEGTQTDDNLKEWFEAEINKD